MSQAVQQQPPKLGGFSLDPEAIMAAVGVSAEQRNNVKNQSCCCKALTGFVCLLCCPITCPLICCAVCCGACCAAKAAGKANGAGGNGNGAGGGDGWTGDGQARAAANEG